MKVTFLGTGTSQGVPVVSCKCAICQSPNPKDKRLRSSVLIQDQGVNVVIDSGPDFRQQMLREKLETLDAIVYTHEHKDHIGGMDDIRGFNFTMGKEIDLFMTERVLDQMKREFAYVFAENKYPGIPEVKVQLVTNNIFNIKHLAFLPIEIMHLKLPIMGYRIGKFTYITDMKSITDIEKEKIVGSEVIVVNALRREPHVSHITFNEAVAFMHELRPRKGYFTHISHQLGLHDDVMNELPDFIELAYDGLTIEL